MKSVLIDKDVSHIETANGVMSLSSLFVPIFIEQLLMNMMGTVNTLILGRYSDNAVAAVGASNQVIGFALTFYSVLSGGAAIFISHRLGEKNDKVARQAGVVAIIAELLFSAVATVILLSMSEFIMVHLNLSGEVYDMAVVYFRIVMGFSCIQAVILAFSAILRSNGYPKKAVIVSVFMNLVNAVLDFLIVFRPIDIPLRGVTGIAWANVIAHIIALIHIFILVWQKRSVLLPDYSDLSFSKDKFLYFNSVLFQILHVGVPGGISNLSYSFSQIVSTSIMAALGTMVLTTKIYVSSVVFYVYVTGFSLGLSVSIMIGWMTGAKEYDKAYKLNISAVKIAVLMNFILSIVIFVLHKPIMGLFTQNPEIIALSAGIFFIDIFVEIGRALNHIEENSLRGAGDVVFPMVISIVSCWLVSILVSYFLGIKLGLGLYGCWIAFMMDELFRGIIFYKRFGSKKWMEAKV
ncbi:MAG: MATE family efflux transporter [Butyrivibrio sp.]|nr:MATE family efflux transporter [Butyrivibrio sp.]